MIRRRLAVTALAAASSLTFGGCETAKSIAGLPLLPVALYTMATSEGTKSQVPLARGPAPLGAPTPTMDANLVRYVSLLEPQLVATFGPPEARAQVADGVDLTWLSKDCRLTAQMRPIGDAFRAVWLTSSKMGEGASRACIEAFQPSPKK